MNVINSKGVRLNRLLEWLISIDAFFSLSPYLIWKTYKYSYFFIIFSSGIEVLICSLYIYRNIRTKGKIKRSTMNMIVGFFVVYYYYIFDAYNGQFSFGISNILKPLVICIFLLLSTESKRNVLILFTKIFAASLTLALLTQLFCLIGVPLPHNVIVPVAKIKTYYNHQYTHFFGCVFMENIYWSPRFKPLCGMYDEHGLVGTVAALLLCANNFEFKRDKSLYIILIGGLTSISLAFYIIVAAYLVGGLVIEKKIKAFKRVAITITLSVILFLIFRNNEFIYTHIISRLSFAYLSNNNRTNDTFNSIFNEYLKSSNVIFGLGNGNPIFNTVDAASYKVILFNLGFVGFLIYLTWWLYWGVKESKKTPYGKLLLIVFFLSFYQRPWLLYLYYIVILFGGISYQKVRGVYRSSIQKQS